MSMEELRKMAFAYYKISNEDMRESFETFTQGMNPENTGVKFKEFFKYMVLMEYDPASRMCSEEFFNELNQDGTGKLSFLDKVTLFYIVQGGIPFCDGDCKQFIKANSYFTCVNCFENERDISFNICCNCLAEGKHSHSHKAFMDPTVLLKFIWLEKAFKNKPAADHDQTSTNMNYEQRSPYAGASLPYVPQPLPSSSTSTALVNVENPRSKEPKRVDRALAIMQFLVSTGNLIAAAQMCTVM